MPSIRITKTVVDQTAPASKDVVVHDTELKGFQLRVTPGGKRVFYVYYRARGAQAQQRRYKLGDYPKISAQRAREMAQTVLGQVASGADPAALRKTERHRLNTGRVDEIVDRYLIEYVANNRTASETVRIFRRNVLPVIGKRSIHDLTRADISHMLSDIAKTAPTMANRVLAAVRKFFNWCYSNSIVEKSPSEGISAPSRENQRDRLLDDGELSRVVAAARQIGFPYGVLVELLALTGQRRDEVAAMAWTEIDIPNRTWTIPGARAKNGKAHIVHLSAAALRLLDTVLVHGPIVLSIDGMTPFQGFSRAKTRLDKLSGVSDWRLHDLRRTFASGMARLGVAPHVADKVLNHQLHTMSSTAAVYQRHAFLDERRAALDRWSAHVDGLMNGVLAVDAKTASQDAARIENP